MAHYLNTIDVIHANVILDIKKQHPNWMIDSNFTVYREIMPVIEGISFQTTFLLRKRSRTSVILMQEPNGRKIRQYFNEYRIIETLIYLYDYYIEEGDAFYYGMCKLIEDNGVDVSFSIGDEQFSFKGIQYFSSNKLFLSFADYQININDFICLLNLVIEKDRYSKESENGKGTILKYLLFLLLCSTRTSLSQKTNMINVLKSKDLYKDNTLASYKEVINRTGTAKLYFSVGLFKNIL